MTRTIAGISVSPDGFVTEPDPSLPNDLDTRVEALHAWASPDGLWVLREGTARSSASVLGRRLFDAVDGPKDWDDRSGYGISDVGKPAFVVMTSSPPEPHLTTDLDWRLITTGLCDTVSAARERADAVSPDSGEDLDVVLLGGRATIGTDPAEALTPRLAPQVLCAGTATLHRRSDAPAGTAEPAPDINRATPDLRRFPVIR